MAKEATQETTVSFVEALKSKGNEAQVDPDPLEESSDDEEEMDIFAGETELEDTESETQPTDEEKAEKKKADDKAKWDADRQKRDEARAERLRATETKVTELAASVEELSKANRELLAQLVQGAAKKDGEAEETLSADPGALAEALKELDPEKTEFPDLVAAFNAIVKSRKGDKAIATDLRKALADQEKRHKEELATQAKRHDDRDTRDANRAAEDAFTKHLDGVMLTMFKGEQAMRKTVEKRALEIVTEHGFTADEQVPLRTAKLALTSAGKEVAAKLAAEKRGREKPPTQDDLAGDFGDVLAKGSQDMQGALKTMGKRAL